MTDIKIKGFFLFRKGFWIFIIKIFFLALVAIMMYIQIPEILYDLKSSSPLRIRDSQDLSRQKIKSTVFASLTGKANFDQAFIYKRYGLEYTYFLVEPYGINLVVRTYDKVTEDWKKRNTFLGKLRYFEDQPFSYRIRDIYKDKYNIDVPKGSFFLALGDVPKISGWQVGAFIFALIVWVIMFYMFFFFRKQFPDQVKKIYHKFTG